MKIIKSKGFHPTITIVINSDNEIKLSLVSTSRRGSLLSLNDKEMRFETSFMNNNEATFFGLKDILKGILEDELKEEDLEIILNEFHKSNQSLMGNHSEEYFGRNYDVALIISKNYHHSYICDANIYPMEYGHWLEFVEKPRLMGLAIVEEGNRIKEIRNGSLANFVLFKKKFKKRNYRSLFTRKD